MFHNFLRDDEESKYFNIYFLIVRLAEKMSGILTEGWGWFSRGLSNSDLFVSGGPSLEEVSKSVLRTFLVSEARFSFQA